jgi:hypothetical protein
MGEKAETGEGITVDGCGMDMGFALVYNLGRALYRDGFQTSTTAKRPSDGKGVKVGTLTREQIQRKAAKGWTFTGGRNGSASGWDNDGGYSLHHRWS